MRRKFWKLHSWLGLFAGLGLVVLGLTGSLLVFKEDLEKWINPEIARVTPDPDGRQSLDTLLASAQQQLPEHEITGWLPQYEHPDTADVLYVIERGHNEWLIATLDPYTGRLLATPRDDSSTLTGWLLELHYAFFADHAGMIVVGLFGIVLCLLGITGVWIYREFWKHVFLLRWGRSTRILFSDLHKFIGITTVVFQLILGFTGAYWNLTHVIGHWIHGDPPQPVIADRLYAPDLSLEGIARDAHERIPGFRANFISLPSDPAAPTVTLWGAIEPRGNFTGPYGTNLVYDPVTQQHQSTTDLRQQSAWSRFVDAFTPLHFGTFGGLWSKILWSLGGLTPGILAVSGFVIWQCRRRRSKAAIVVPAPTRTPEHVQV
jgi:uncharacterized iron-regulated membrane protein